MTIQNQTQNPKCVVRIHYRDALTLCREFGKEEELKEVVKKKDQYLAISLTGSLLLAKVFSSHSYKTKRTMHTYYLYGFDKEEVTTVLSTTCGKRVRGCFIPIPHL